MKLVPKYSEPPTTNTVVNDLGEGDRNRKWAAVKQLIDDDRLEQVSVKGRRGGGLGLVVGKSLNLTNKGIEAT
jgi:hypothetical protein